MKITVVKKFGKYVPAYDSDYEKSKKHKEGEFYEIEIKQPRNIKFHNKYFALLNLVFENQENYTNIDDLRREITIDIGYYHEYVTIHGEIKKQAKSISFANMDDFEFSELYGKTINEILANYLTGNTREEIENEILENFENKIIK